MNHLVNIHRIHAVLGMLVIIAIGYALSMDRRAISWKEIRLWLFLQPVAAIICAPRNAWSLAGIVSLAVQKFAHMTSAGASFIWGDEMANPNGLLGFVFAAQVLPSIVCFYALIEVVAYISSRPEMSRSVKSAMDKVASYLGLSGAEAVVAVAKIFIGHTQTPALVGEQLKTLPQYSLLTIMTLGFATMSGELFTVYAGMIATHEVTDQATGKVTDIVNELVMTEAIAHIFASTIMSIPAAILISRILMPRGVDSVPIVSEELSELVDHSKRIPQSTSEVGSLFEAVVVGAQKGVSIAISIAAVLLALLGLLKAINFVCAYTVGHPVQDCLGYFLQPICWLFGFHWDECYRVGRPVGLGIVGTEFLAFKALSDEIQKAGGEMGGGSWQALAIYPICSFASLPSIAIQVGALTALVPNRRSVFVELAPRAALGGFLASCMSTCFAAILC